MPTVIDALVVTLGVPPDKPKADIKAIRDALEKFRRDVLNDAKETEAANKKVADGFGNIKREALGAFAVVIGANGLKEYISRTVTDFSTMGRVAKAAGENVADLAAFGNMVARNGGNAEQARASLSGLAAQMERMRTLGQASPELRGALQLIGASGQDKATEVFDKFAKYAEGRDPRQVAMIGGMLGFDEAAINQAMKGQATFRAEMEKSRKLGVPKQDDIDKVTGLQREFRKLQQSVAGSANELLIGAAPALTTTLHLVEDLTEKVPGLTKAVIVLGVAFGFLKSVAIGKALLGGGRAAGAAAGLAGAGEAAAAGGGLLGLGAAGLAAAGFTAAAGIALFPTSGNQGEDAAIARMRAQGRWAGDSRNPADLAGRWAQYKSYLMAHGLSDAEATGVMAGMRAENGTLDPNNKNPNSTAYGLGQWTTKRQRDFQQFAGKDIHGSTWREQLDFMLHEWSHKEAAAFGSIKGHSSGSAMVNYILRYMRPGIGGEQIGDLRRGTAALRGAGVHIDKVEIVTTAGNAPGIARDFRAALARELMAAQGNGGLQ